MERRGVECSLLSTACLLMMFVVGGWCNKLTEFNNCYGARFSLCVIVPQNSVIYCAAKVMPECTPILQGSSNPSEAQLTGDKKTIKGIKRQYCELGCALSRCSNISTALNPQADKVATCVNSCSEIDCKPSPSNLVTHGIGELNTNNAAGEFCKLGCASSACRADISTNPNPAGKEEIGCDHCTTACANGVVL